MTTERTQAAPFIGSSAIMAHVRNEIAIASAADDPVFITGESGTGKDLAAIAIHESSKRSTSAFVTLSASGVPDDILDRELFGAPDTGRVARYASVPRFLARANDGTLFIDDICRVSQLLQSRLLHLIRTREIVRDSGQTVPFTARLIAATNTDLAECLRSGRLRRDLYDQIAVLTVGLPPLRERGNDAGEIARELFPELLTEAGSSPRPLPAPVIARINALSWPGNVRQLLNILRRLTLCPIGEEVRAFDAANLQHSLPEKGFDGFAGMTFDAIEKRVILQAIDRNAGSVQRAAQELELAASTIYRKLKAWQDDSAIR